MKKNVLTNLMMMAMMALVSMTFAACGGDDKDDIPGDDKVLKEGVHRMEVYFSGSDKWNISGSFTATYGYGSTDIYENGKKVSEYAGVYDIDEFRDYVVETGKDCDQMVLTFATKPKSKSSEDLTVTLKGFIDGKQTNMKVYTIKANDPKTMVFFCQDVGGDLIQ